MMGATSQSPHTFYIPVMGTGFMIDAPLRVARYGISSTISLVDDVLIEQMRKYHCEQAGLPYQEIEAREEDSRARRITAYLNLVDTLVRQQVAALRESPFEPGSEITRYFELLPDGAVKDQYNAMLAATDPQAKARLQAELRDLVVPGSIDANIMSKGDRSAYKNGELQPPQFSDASAALRGFARSTLNSSIVFSAGMNARLYSYAAEFSDFFPDEQGRLAKLIVLKVSDYHSAAVQGRFLAKRGLWVSEYHIESGVNCGGHAFATKGLLLGPILDEFQRCKGELVAQLHEAYAKALRARGQQVGPTPYPVRITVQGGIGTADEDRLLRGHYRMDATGWATPFLLVPEVTNLDDEHRRKLCEAGQTDVYLSDSSPFGLPFWNLRTSSSEEARRSRIAEGRPGSPCSKGFIKLFNREFTDLPLCTASRTYQKLKLAELARQDASAAEREAVLVKSCICNDLAGAATLAHGIDPDATPAVCCGPNIVNFSRIATLEEMVGHIYGRLSLFASSQDNDSSEANRPHMFVRELEIYVEYLRTQIAKAGDGLASITPEYVREFKENLLAGIAHYRQRAGHIAASLRDRFLESLSAQQTAIDSIPTPA